MIEGRAEPEEPLVLLPGMNCSASLWAGLNLGPSVTPLLTEPTPEAQVTRLLDELPRRFSLAGLSLGAIVAMALIRTAPERVSRLCLLSSNPYAPTQAQRSAWLQQRSRLASGSTARELQAELLTVLLSPEAQARMEIVNATLAMADEIGEDILDAQLQLQATRVDERPQLGRIRCPVLVVAAHLDALCGVERHREIQALIDDAELVVLEGAGHLSPLEVPQDLTRYIEAWLAGERQLRRPL
jgi:pimeloyl-ACP methyl ester carboxylesterase